MNLIDYVKKYGNFSFSKKKFNEIDNLVFSSLSYIDFDENKIKENNTLEYIGKDYLNKKIKVKDLILAKRDAYELLEVIVDKKRYKDVRIRNYIYKADYNMQFKAMTFVISSNLNYISFEGTDELISGWIEDFSLAYMFPTPSQKLAVKYVNDNVKIFGPKVIIGGHSKGGNLALVSAMYMKKIKRLKLKYVYNNDGPGLRDNEFESLEYKSIKSRYKHIIPHSSIVGILLKDSNYFVIRSKKNNAIGHSLNTWLVDDDKLIQTDLSKRSTKIKNNLDKWRLMHSDDDFRCLVEDLFNILRDSDIDTLNNMKNIKNIISIIKKIKYLDKDTKEILKELFLYGYIGVAVKD